MNIVPKKELIIKKIDEFLSLENNWDGYGAIPPSIEVANNAKELINYIPTSLFEYFDDGYPNTQGTICFEWKKDGDELFIEIGDKSCSYLLLQDGILLFKESNSPINKITFETIVNYIKQISE
jgi:hypothetical protein